jgi:HEAT repeat protein
LAAPAVPELIKAAQCADPFVEQEAVRALSEIGPAASPAKDLLIQIVEEACELSHGGLKSLYAVRALGNIGDHSLQVFDLLQKASSSTDDSLAQEGRIALERYLKVGEQPTSLIDDGE